MVNTKNTGITGSYDRIYTALHFDRAGLFKLIKDEYGCSTVLYPGCSVHITPSFYFRHVVYIDVSETAKEFFQDKQKVLSIINNRKKYKQPAYINFLSHDYTEELPVRENNYDLLLSIYAGGIIKSCKKYVKTGGIIVSNNHLNDARDALEDTSVSPEALIRRKGGKYRLEAKANDILLAVLKDRARPSSNMRCSGSGSAFVDNEIYFLFRKTK